MTERPSLKVVPVEADAPPSPAAIARTHFASLAQASLKECLDTNPSVIMMVWESKDGANTALRSLMIPGSQAVFRGLVELLWEQLNPKD